MADALPTAPRARLGWREETQTGTSRDEGGGGAGLVQQRRDVDCGRTAADHGDVASREPGQVMVRRTVRHQFGGQLRQLRGYLAEMRYADRADDEIRPQDLPVVQPDREAVAHLVQRNHLAVFQVGDESLLEVE